ncbi:MAG TPA: patatin-like phospholipase family protein [Alphaproteobacteria bacterium]|nr:patatin-like phospholipase family protein [Alphaproteobacteria bacterium]
MSGSRIPIGIALGSGIARGWAHIGVLRGLERLGIEPDIVCGTSIGALIGGVYLGEGLDRLEVWARELNRLKMTRLFDFQIGRGGLIAGRRIMQIFDEELHAVMIEDLPARFACVCTDLDTGHEVWLQRGKLLEAVRASYALPGLFPPVKIDGRWLLDGALVNPIPVSMCRALGARLVIAVNLNADLFDTASLGTARELEAADENAIITRLRNLPGADMMRQLFSHRTDEPSVLSVMTRSLHFLQDRISRARLAGDPPDVTIAPKIGRIGILQFDRAAESIEAGEEAVRQAAPVLEEALQRYAGQGAGSYARRED